MALSATFCFTIVERINLQTLSRIIDNAVVVAESTHTFTKFCVYLEEGTVNVPPESIPQQKVVGAFEGRIFTSRLSQLRQWLSEKRDSERRTRLQPGHTSYTPPMILGTNTCVIVLGSREFCAVMARLHMEEIVSLRIKLVDILEGLCALKPMCDKPRVSHDDVLIVSVQPDAKDYITYNLNWMANQIRRSAGRHSTGSLLRRLR